MQQPRICGYLNISENCQIVGSRRSSDSAPDVPQHPKRPKLCVLRCLCHCHSTLAREMAPPPSSGHVFYIISRVLSPDGERLAVQYKGPNENVTLELLDENNDNQLWVIKSPTERTTIVPSLPETSKQFTIWGSLPQRSWNNLKTGHSRVSSPLPLRESLFHGVCAGLRQCGTARKRPPVARSLFHLNLKSPPENPRSYGF
ncbi:hypothetical protein BS47DRAFT_275765 [Hydnum rufescens UP504]|uniref:CCL2-like lectin domain-containing protein n=1 Tax=Hydnum rufescens UP504 TaxID=1448309 RepID=A0A9P6DM96_9AGAM|nr:hypothetical protein BS47DRAFT_275765 [Hydnum rufescens UP504]